MKLTCEQIKDITRGALDVFEDSCGVHFRRFAPAQAEYLLSVSNFTKKVFNTAGVKFDFYTDSEYLALEFSFGIRSTSKQVAIDTYVDGALVHNEDYIPVEGERASYKACFDKKGRKRVSVYLPHTTELVLTSFSLSDAATVEPYTAYAKKVLVCGDSITQGHHSEYTSLSYANRLASFFGWDILNQAIAGYWFDGKWVDGKIDFAPELITVAYGTNDWSAENTVENFEANLRGFFDALTSAFPKVPIAVLLPIWRYDEKKDNFCTFDEHRARIVSIAGEYKLTYVVDSYRFVPHLPEFFADDGVHPNSLGHAEYARGVAAALMKYGLEK